MLHIRPGPEKFFALYLIADWNDPRTDEIEHAFFFFCSGPIVKPFWACVTCCPLIRRRCIPTMLQTVLFVGVVLLPGVFPPDQYHASNYRPAICSTLPSLTSAPTLQH